MGPIVSQERKSLTYRGPDFATVHYLLSFSRSGETLVSRHLALSSEIQVGYNLYARDREKEAQLNSFLRSQGSPRHLSQSEVEKFDVRVPKVFAKAIYPHASQTGIVLSRHPLAVANSIVNIFRRDDSEQVAKRVNRLVGYVDPSLQELSPQVEENSIITKWSIAWSIRMAQAFALQQPVVRFEELVVEPDREFSRITQALSIDFTAKMKFADCFFPSNLTGHGGINLSQPISPGAAEPRLSLSDRQIHTVLRECEETMEMFGYGQEFTADPVHLLPRMSDIKVPR